MIAPGVQFDRHCGFRGRPAGRAVRIARKLHNGPLPATYYTYPLVYNYSAELWLVVVRTRDEAGGCPGGLWGEGDGVVAVHDFRTAGRKMRFTTKRQADAPGEIMPGTRVWHDYDGDEIYADVRIDFEETMHDFTTTQLASHELGVGSNDGSEAVYQHGDQIGSTRMLTYDGASVGRQAVYTAFGERVWSDGSIGATRYQYAGAWGYQTFPEHTGQPGDEIPFIHVGHRWYDPATGRFLQRDPIGLAGGLNAYAYAYSAPTNEADPEGFGSATHPETYIATLETEIAQAGEAVAHCGGRRIIVKEIIRAPTKTPGCGQTVTMKGHYVDTGANFTQTFTLAPSAPPPPPPPPTAGISDKVYIVFVMFALVLLAMLIWISRATDVIHWGGADQ